MKTKKIFLNSLAIATLPMFVIFIITRPWVSEYASINPFNVNTLIGLAIMMTGITFSVWADSIKVPNSGDKKKSETSRKMKNYFPHLQKAAF